MRGGTLRELRSMEGPTGALLAVVGLSTVSAMFEAASLVFVVALAEAISTGQDRFDKTLGPVSLDLGRTALAAAALLCIVAALLLVLTTTYVRAVAITRWTRARRWRVIASFLDADWSIQANERAGRLQTVAGYLGQAQLALVNAAAAARGLTGVAVLMGTALLVSPVAALGILVLGGVLFLALRPLNNLARAKSHLNAVQSQEYNENVGELAELARDVRVFGVASQFRARSDAAVEGLATSEQQVAILSGAVAPVYQSAALAVIVVVLALASASGGADLAVLGAVALLVLRSVSYGQQFQTSFTSIQVAMPAYHRFAEAVAELQERSPVFGGAELDAVHEVVFEGVSYAYDEAESALDGVDLRLTKGEIVGVVGPSGSGKSTLAQILLRLRAAKAGVVAVNGRPIDEYSTASWSRQVSLVPQQTHLVHGTVAENVTFFRPDIDREEVGEAVTAAGIAELVASLPDGLDTHIGKATRDLSGGQVQRIGIARALAGEPSLLVLDEPTSALDQTSEAWVQQTLAELRGRAIVVVIAHRLSTLSICDRVVVLDGGRVVADGTVSEAAEASPFFRQALAHGHLSSGSEDEAQGDEASSEADAGAGARRPHEAGSTASPPGGAGELDVTPAPSDPMIAG